MKFGITIGSRFYGWGGTSPYLSDSLGAVYDNSGAVAVTAKNAARISAVYACVNILADNIASLPKHVVELSDDGHEAPVATHPVASLLNTPRGEVDGFQFWEFVLRNLFMAGNGLALIERSGAYATGLAPITPAQVAHVKLAPGGIIYEIDVPLSDNAAAPKRVRVGQADIVHFAGAGFDGLWAPSPIKIAAAAAGRSLAIQKIFSSLLKNAVRPSGTIETPQTLSPEQFSAFKDKWEAQYAGVEASGKTPFLPPGFKWTGATLSRGDMDLIEAMKFDVEDIARVFNVPLFLLARTESASWAKSNVSEQWTNFVRSSLRAHLVRLQAQLENKLLPTRPGSKRLGIRFDVTPLVRATRKEMFDDAALGLAGGFMTANEARRMIGLSPIAGGDVLHAPAGTPSRRTGDDKQKTKQKGDDDAKDN